MSPDDLIYEGLVEGKEQLVNLNISCQPLLSTAWNRVVQNHQLTINTLRVTASGDATHRENYDAAKTKTFLESLEFTVVLAVQYGRRAITHKSSGLVDIHENFSARHANSGLERKAVSGDPKTTGVAGLATRGKALAAWEY